MNWKRISLAFIIIIIIVSGIFIVLHYQNKQQISQIQPPIKPIPSLNQSLIANWNIYTSSKSALTFKYPSTWVVNKHNDSPYDDLTILPQHSFEAIARIQDGLSNPPHLAYFASPHSGFEIVEKNISVGKVPAKEYDATYRSGESNQQNTDVEITFSDKDMSYDIQLLNYADKEIFDNILNTFTFTNPNSNPALPSK